MKIELPKNSFIFLIWNLTILAIISVIFENAGIFAVGLFGILVVLLCSLGLDNYTWRIVIICSTIAILWMTFQYFGLVEIFGKPYYAHDDETYERYGRIFYDAEAYLLYQAPKVDYTLEDVRGYFWIVSWIIRICSIFGSFHTIAPRIINIYLWISTAVLTYKIIKQEDDSFDYRISDLVLFGLAIFPNALYISSFVYRDTLCIFLVITFVYCFGRLERQMQSNEGIRISNVILWVAICAISIYLLFATRKKLIVLLGAIGAVDILLKQNSKNLILRRAILLAIFVIVGGTTVLDQVLKVSRDYGNYIMNTLGYSEGLSGKIFSVPILPFGIFLRAIWGLMCPFPGGIFQQDFLHYPLYSIEQTIVYMGTVFQLLCVPYLVKGIKKFDENALDFLLAYLMVVATTFTFRHFIIIYPFLAIEIYYGLKQVVPAQIKNYTIFLLFVIISGGLIYLTLK